MILRKCEELSLKEFYILYLINNNWYQNAESVSDKTHLINDFEIMETSFVYNNAYYIYNEVFSVNNINF